MAAAVLPRLAVEWLRTVFIARSIPAFAYAQTIQSKFSSRCAGHFVEVALLAGAGLCVQSRLEALWRAAGAVKGGNQHNSCRPGEHETDQPIAHRRGRDREQQGGGYREQASRYGNKPGHHAASRTLNSDPNR